MTTKTDVCKSSCLLRHLARFQSFFGTALTCRLASFSHCGVKKEEEPLGGSRQRESSDQEGDHHHVGEQGREVGHLAGAAHTLPEKVIRANAPRNYNDCVSLPSEQRKKEINHGSFQIGVWAWSYVQNSIWHCTLSHFLSPGRKIMLWSTASWSSLDILKLLLHRNFTKEIDNICSKFFFNVRMNGRHFE